MRCGDACASARPSIEGLGIVAARPCYRPCGGANKLGRELQLGFSVLLLIPSAVTIHGTGAMACGTNMHTWKWNAGGESSAHGQVRCRVASAAQSAAVRVLLSAYITAALLHGLTGLALAPPEHVFGAGLGMQEWTDVHDDPWLRLLLCCHCCCWMCAHGPRCEPMCRLGTQPSAALARYSIRDRTSVTCLHTCLHTCDMPTCRIDFRWSSLPLPVGVLWLMPAGVWVWRGM